MEADPTGRKPNDAGAKLQGVKEDLERCASNPAPDFIVVPPCCLGTPDKPLAVNRSNAGQLAALAQRLSLEHVQP